MRYWVVSLSGSQSLCQKEALAGGSSSWWFYSLLTHCKQIANRLTQSSRSAHTAGYTRSYVTSTRAAAQNQVASFNEMMYTWVGLLSCVWTHSNMYTHEWYVWQCMIVTEHALRMHPNCSGMLLYVGCLYVPHCQGCQENVLMAAVFLCFLQ